MQQSSKIEGSILTLMGTSGTIRMNKIMFEGRERGRQFLEFIRGGGGIKGSDPVKPHSNQPNLSRILQTKLENSQFLQKLWRGQWTKIQSRGGCGGG